MAHDGRSPRRALFCPVALRGSRFRYLIDLLPEELHGVVRFEVAGDGTKPPAPPEKSLLPSTTVAALTVLQALSIRNAKARVRVQWFAEILREAHHT